MVFVFFFVVFLAVFYSFSIMVALSFWMVFFDQTGSLNQTSQGSLF